MKIHTILNILVLVWASTVCLAQSAHFTSNGTWISIGDIDIQGNQITVEALIYMDDNTSINIVSKHTAPWNVNYLLRPFTFELTTYVNGNSGPTQFLQMWNPFTLDQNKWYHIAGTYNGMSVKYYVDGCLVIEQPFSGNLFQNNFLTAIGNQSTCQCEQFLGKIDEVRIWNVCRTEDEIRGNMLNLPNPTLQTGLVAYYKLDNSLVNNQGNPMWNGTLVGNVQFSIDQANIQPFAISSLQVINVDCENISNGSITISTNRPNTQYSLDNINFQTSNTFSNLADGVYQVYAKSPEGCIIDTTLTINNNLYVQTNQTVNICQGETYNGLSTSGTYIDTIQATLGCDSIRTTNLTVLPNPTLSQSVSICQGEMYEGYSSSGTYVDVFTAANGCDSTRTLVLTVLPNSASTQSVSICQGEVYEGYSSSGTYIDIFTAANGCDSTRTLMLTVLPNAFSSQTANICQGEMYEGHSMSGIYVDTLQAANGCDSTRTLMLTVVPNLTSLQSVSICQGEVYEGYSSSGTYIDIFTAANGCDSTRTLMLTVLPNASSLQSVSICQGEVYEGYSSSGTYIDIFTAANGCDSTRTLMLTVLPNASSLQTVSICQGEVYEGYSSSGTYSDVFTAANGCDSTRTLVLTVNANSESIQNITICAGSTYDFNGQSISNEGIYSDTLITSFGCDSIVTVNVKIARNDFLGNDVTLCTENEYELKSPSENTRWFDNTIGKTKKVNSTGNYWATILDANGCEIIDTILVRFNFKSYVPNVFSPNDDGENDCFQPFFSELGFSSYRLSVFDRWGNHIFSTENPDDCWNGKNKDKDKECSPGVYVYFIEIKTEVCDKTLIKGDVTLIK